MTLGHCSHLLDSSHLNSPNKGIATAVAPYLLHHQRFSFCSRISLHSLYPSSLAPLVYLLSNTKCPQEEFYTLAVSNFSPPGVFWSNSNQVFIFATELLLRTQMITTLRVAVIGSRTFCCLTVVFDTVNIYFLHEIPAWIWDILLMFSHLPGHSVSVFYDFLDCPTSRHLLSKWSLPVLGH